MTFTLIQDLQAGLKKALSGEVETLLLELLMPPLEFEANRLQQAMVVRLSCVVFSIIYLFIYFTVGCLYIYINVGVHSF